MGTNRKTLPTGTISLVLHECGYKCGNPACRGIITLDIHHIVRVADGGGNVVDNLLALCPNCHALHHTGEIPIESIRTWKMLLLSLNEGFDRASVNMLLALHKLGGIRVTPDALLTASALVASDLIETTFDPPANPRYQGQNYQLKLSTKGRLLVEGWKAGDQKKALSSSVVLDEP